MHTDMLAINAFRCTVRLFILVFILGLVNENVLIPFLKKNYRNLIQ